LGGAGCATLAAAIARSLEELPSHAVQEFGSLPAPWQFSDLQPEIARGGPMTGEHNELVFGEILGLSRREMADLAEAGVIA